MHLYHCHANPLKRHVHKGLYGAFIIDPPATSSRPPSDELVMVLNAFDTNFDAENEVYAANTVASFYVQEPIRVQVGQLVRMYVVNLTEFDLINSMHLHGMFFDVFRTGTSLIASESTDTIMLSDIISSPLRISSSLMGSNAMPGYFFSLWTLYRFLDRS